MNTLHIRPQIMYSPDGVGSGGGGSDAPPSTPTPAPSASPTPDSSSAPSGEASSTPTSPPSAAPSPGPTPDSSQTAPGDGLFSFPDDMMTGSDPDEPTLQPAPVAPTPAPAQAAPPASETPAQQPTPTPAPAAPAPVAPGPAEASPPLLPSEPAAIGQSLLDNQEHLIGELSKGLFALTPEEVEAIETDATTAIPRILSKVYIHSQANALKQVSRIVPAMIEKYMKTTMAQKENENAFYKAWPQLDAATHGELVNRTARAFRQANPNVTRAQMIAELGPLVMTLAKIPLTPTAPAAGSSGNRPPPAPPFQPARGGPAAPPSTPVPDEWSGLGQDLSEG